MSDKIESANDSSALHGKSQSMDDAGGTAASSKKPFSLVRTLLRVPLAIRDAYHKYQQTLIEGHYRSNAMSAWLVMIGVKKKDPPKTTRAVAGDALLSTGKSVGKRFMWLSAFAVFSATTLATVGAGLATIGVGLMAAEFFWARRSRNDVIRERNFAGQLVEGTRADLCRLYQTQCAIMSVHENFQEGSLESTSETISRLVKGVEAETARVKILEPGRFGARADTYDFSEPAIKLVFDEEHKRAAMGAVTASETTPEVANDRKPLASRVLKDDWARAMERQQSLEKRIAELEAVIKNQNRPPSSRVA